MPRYQSARVTVICGYCNSVLLRTTVKRLLRECNIKIPKTEYVAELGLIASACVKALAKNGILRCPKCGRALQLRPDLRRVRIELGREG